MTGVSATVIVENAVQNAALALVPQRSTSTSCKYGLRYHTTVTAVVAATITPTEKTATGFIAGSFLREACPSNGFVIFAASWVTAARFPSLEHQELPDSSTRPGQRTQRRWRQIAQFLVQFGHGLEKIEQGLQSLPRM